MMHAITLAGKNYPLHFTVNALCLLEEKAGMSLDHLQENSLSCIRALLWCALLHDQPALTLTDAGNLLENHPKGGGTLNDVAACLARALEDACFFQQAGAETAMNP